MNIIIVKSNVIINLVLVTLSIFPIFSNSLSLSYLNSKCQLSLQEFNKVMLHTLFLHNNKQPTTLGPSMMTGLVKSIMLGSLCMQ